jgi:hypothetical protein
MKHIRMLIAQYIQLRKSCCREATEGHILVLNVPNRESIWVVVPGSSFDIKEGLGYSCFYFITHVMVKEKSLEISRLSLLRI